MAMTTSRRMVVHRYCCRRPRTCWSSLRPPPRKAPGQAGQHRWRFMTRASSRSMTWRASSRRPWPRASAAIPASGSTGKPPPRCSAGQQPQVRPVAGGNHVVRDETEQHHVQNEDGQRLRADDQPAPDPRPVISVRYTTLMARNPANPSVSAIERKNSAEKFVTYANGQINNPASAADLTSAFSGRSVRQPADGVAADQDADPGCMAYRTEYSNDKISCAGSDKWVKRPGNPVR